MIILLGTLWRSSALPLRLNAFSIFGLCLCAAKDKYVMWSSLECRNQIVSTELCVSGWVREQGLIQRDPVKLDTWLCRITLHLSPTTTSLETEKELIKAQANESEWRDIIVRYTAWGLWWAQQHNVPGGNKTDLTSLQMLHLVIHPLMTRTEPTAAQSKTMQSLKIILPGEQTCGWQRKWGHLESPWSLSVSLGEA